MLTEVLPKILVVDNEPQLLETIGFLVEDRYRIEGCTTGERALAAAGERVYPVAIVDLRLNDWNGLDLMRRLRTISPFTQVIILTGHASMESAIGALNEGAFRYLVKPFERLVFLQAIESALTAYDAALLSHERLTVPADRLEAMGLSPRLAEVAEGILHGRTNEEIARELEIASRTVEKHVERLLAHLEFRAAFSSSPVC